MIIVRYGEVGGATSEHQTPTRLSIIPESSIGSFYCFYWEEQTQALLILSNVIFLGLFSSVLIFYIVFVPSLLAKKPNKGSTNASITKSDSAFKMCM